MSKITFSTKEIKTLQRDRSELASKRGRLEDYPLCINFKVSYY